MLANEAGALDVSPAGRPFLRDGNLMPGTKVSGAVTIRNQTPKPLATRVRASAGTDDLERLLEVVVSSGDTTLYRGTLDGLRRWTARSLALDLGERRRLEIAVGLPADAAGRSDSRAAEMTLELLARPARG